MALVVIRDEDVTWLHRVDLVQINKFPCSSHAQADLVVAVPVHRVLISHHLIGEQMDGEGGVKFIFPVKTFRGVHLPTRRQNRALGVLTGTNCLSTMIAQTCKNSKKPAGIVIKSTGNGIDSIGSGL